MLGAVLVAGVLAAGAGGYPGDRVRLMSGAAWLPSTAVGQIALLDGAAAEVAAQVQVAARGEHLDVVQSGQTAYAINRTTGSIRRVDGGTFTPAAPATLLPEARDGLQVFVGGDTLYAVDAARGILAAGDPLTLARRGQPALLGSDATPGGAVLDSDGLLWMLDRRSGDLIWIDHGRQHRRRGAATAGAGAIVAADGAPVIVDTQRHTISWLDRGTGDPRSTTALDVPADDQVQLGGSAHAARIYLVSARGVLAVCDARADCADAVPLDVGGGRAADLGAPVESGDRLFIPDYSTGRVLVVDLRDRRVTAQPQVLDARTRFQLLNRDGVVFFNDPGSERAGVIRLDGGVQPIRKYDTGNQPAGTPTPTATPTKPATTGPAPTPTGTPVRKPSPTVSPTPRPNPTTRSPSARPAPAIRLVLSATSAPAGTDLTMRVEAAPGSAAPAGARWTFGDTAGATGLTVTHRWAAAGTFVVSVTATFADGQTATGAETITIVPPTPTRVDVPDVVGTQQAAALQALTAAGLTSSARQAVSNTVPAGTVLSQTPPAGTSVAPGTAVALTVSSGRRPPYSLVTSAAGADWRTGAGQIPFGGSTVDDRGFALIWQAGVIPLEDGTRPQFLETHPQWVENNTGWITGTFVLPVPVMAGDHFRAGAGFRGTTEGGSPNRLGDVQFVVLARMPDGSLREMVRKRDTADGRLLALDVDLSAAAGATAIQLRVEAGVSSLQDWAAWITPRVEG